MCDSPAKKLTIEKKLSQLYRLLDVMLTSVCGYVTYPSSLIQLDLMLGKCFVAADHTTFFRGCSSCLCRLHEVFW